MSFSSTDLYKQTISGIVQIIEADSFTKSCQHVMESFVTMSDALHGSLFLMKNGQFHRVYSSETKDKWITPSRRGISYQVYKTQSPAIIHERILKKTHPEHLEKGIHMMYVAPLINRNKTLGVVSLHFKKDKKMDQDTQLILQDFGKIFGMILANKLKLISLEKQMKDRKLNTALTAHELKTPLTTISTYAQLITRQFSQGKKITKQWLSVLVDETKRASNIINEYMEEGDNHKVSIECDLHETIERAVVNFSVNYPTHELHVINKLLKHAIVKADPDKILQVVTNILNNAAKFTPVDRIIQIKAFTEEGYYLIKIIDNGRGMKNEELSLIFKRWYKANKAKEGKGLGLYISKKILDEFHGTIEADSIYGQGTTMTVKLPIKTIKIRR